MLLILYPLFGIYLGLWQGEHSFMSPRCGKLLRFQSLGAKNLGVVNCYRSWGLELQRMLKSHIASYERFLSFFPER